MKRAYKTWAKKLYLINTEDQNVANKAHLARKKINIKPETLLPPSMEWYRSWNALFSRGVCKVTNLSTDLDELYHADLRNHIINSIEYLPIFPRSFFITCSPAQGSTFQSWVWDCFPNHFSKTAQELHLWHLPLLSLIPWHLGDEHSTTSCQTRFSGQMQNHLFFIFFWEIRGGTLRILLITKI